MTLAVSTAAPSPLRDTTAATPVCAAEVAPQEFLDEAFQPFGEPEGEEEDEEVTNTVWHLLFSIHIPLLLLRLRRSFYGLTAFVRSILFGQCFQFLMAYFSPSPTTWETLSPWLEPLLGNPHSKDPHAWPPPTLRVLAILTVLAFIVHPDGMTWIMLGKLRNALYTLFESSTTCWNVVIADYGILTTLAALATFASILCLVYVMFKTLSPRTPQSQNTTKTIDRKKKKRKGNHPRGGRGRIQGKGKPQSGRHVSPPRMADQKDSCNAEEEREEASMDSSNHKTDFLPKELTSKCTAAAESGRPRVQSSSTVETVAMDDQSVESASVQSIASAPSAASTVVSRSPQSSNRQEEGNKKNSENVKRTNTIKKGRKGSASKGYGASAVSPSRPDVYRPPAKNTNAYSPATPVNTPPYSARSRSRRGGGNPNANGGRPFRSLHDRMSSPTSNDSLFFTPLSPPVHAHARDRANALNVPTLQTPLLTHQPPTPPSSSLFSQPPTTPTARNAIPPKQDGTTNIFYNAPSFTDSNSFLGNSRRDTPRKMELASFLSRVGISGNVLEDLVEALDGVDSLYKLSDAQFELYNVSPDKKLRIEILLQDRRRARMGPSSPGASPGAIRPPPGLTSPAGVVNSGPQAVAFASPPRLINQATYASSETRPSPGYSTAGRTDVDFGRSPSLSGSNSQIPPLSLLSPYEGSKNSVYEQGDEEIEAELQELGGQMVGSILDF